MNSGMRYLRDVLLNQEVLYNQEHSVYVPTPEDYDRFMELLESEGVTWYSGHKPTQFEGWEGPNGDTIISLIAGSESERCHPVMLTGGSRLTVKPYYTFKDGVLYLPDSKRAYKVTEEEKALSITKPKTLYEFDTEVLLVGDLLTIRESTKDGEVLSTNHCIVTGVTSDSIEVAMGMVVVDYQPDDFGDRREIIRHIKKGE